MRCNMSEVKLGDNPESGLLVSTLGVKMKVEQCRPGISDS